MITDQDIADQREQAQNDIQCIMDGMDELRINAVCQVIVDRMNILSLKLNGIDPIDPSMVRARHE